MKTIAIFVQHPVCSAQSVNGIVKTLSPKYNFKIFTKHEVEDSFFEDVDLVCFPGGVGDSDKFDVLAARHVDSIQSYVRNGGKYLGICMGAYWADSDYFNILGSDNRVVQYIRQPNTCTRRPHAKAMPITWQGKQERMYFYDGCAITGNNLDIVATYSNGDPMAIIQRNIGLIGCHLETEKFWYDYYSWMPKHWHHGKHNELLLEFVDKLMGDV